jgi:hypothetical protein
MSTLSFALAIRSVIRLRIAAPPGGGWAHCGWSQQFGVCSSHPGGRTLSFETHQIFPSVPGEVLLRLFATASRYGVLATAPGTKGDSTHAAPTTAVTAISARGPRPANPLALMTMVAPQPLAAAPATFLLASNATLQVGSERSHTRCAGTDAQRRRLEHPGSGVEERAGRFELDAIEVKPGK